LSQIPKPCRAHAANSPLSSLKRSSAPLLFA